MALGSPLKQLLRSIWVIQEVTSSCPHFLGLAKAGQMGQFGAWVQYFTFHRRTGSGILANRPQIRMNHPTWKLDEKI